MTDMMIPTPQRPEAFVETATMQARIYHDHDFDLTDRRTYRMALSGATGTPVVGDVITGGTTGSTANVTYYSAGSNYVFICEPDGPFKAGETLSFTDGASRTLEPANLSGTGDYGSGMDGNCGYAARGIEDVVDQRLRMPDVDTILADGWTGAKTNDWVTDKWYIAAKTDGFTTNPYRYLVLKDSDDSGEIAHSIVKNTDGVTVIRLVKGTVSGGPETDWSAVISLKESQGGDTVASVEWKNVATPGLILKDKDGAQVGSDVVAGKANSLIATLLIRIDWRTGSVAILTQDSPDDTHGWTAMAASDEYEYVSDGAGDPLWLEITNASATVPCSLGEIAIMDDPWVIIGDSLTSQMVRDSNPILAETLSPECSYINFAQGSSGLIVDAMKSFRDFASTGNLDVLRSPNIAMPALGINDINAAETLADMTDALSEMMADLDGANDSTTGRVRRVVLGQIPPGALLVADDLAKVVAWNAAVVLEAAKFGRGSCAPDLYTVCATTSPDTTRTVIRKEYRRASSGAWAVTQSAYQVDSQSNIHLSRVGCIACTKEISRAMTISESDF